MMARFMAAFSFIEYLRKVSALLLLCFVWDVKKKKKKFQLMHKLHSTPLPPPPDNTGAHKKTLCNLFIYLFLRAAVTRALRQTNKLSGERCHGAQLNADDHLNSGRGVDVLWRLSSRRG